MELHLRGLENLSDEEITKLLLLEDDEILHTHISPLLKYYGKFFCKEPMNKKRGRGWHIIRKQIYENERSAHDAHVLSTAIRDDPMFPKPPENMYYLVDSGYANRRGYLAACRKQSSSGTRYYLQEFLNEEAEAGTYMRTVRNEIAKFMWLKKRGGSHRH
ncbi:unnamed protein product [Thlaspi arvense]|uniref:Transposase n=1 Tax=Thlaspi arvense TaxID=13288 RepID=A0AAU9SE51_THLAR|nr:unnamed protein product [Thlaspi arvense]